MIENAPTTPDRAHEWRQAVRLFCWWGDKYGFGVRELGPAGVGVVTDPAWRVLSKLLKAAGVLAEVGIPGQRGRATAWAPEWNYRRLHDDLGHGRLVLPFPADDPAPEVRYTVPNTTPQIGQHNTATQHGNTGESMTKRTKADTTSTQRAALYARVSTAAQLDNTSPDGQLRRARIYSAERGYEIVGQEVEDISGTFVLARSKFNALLDMGADGRLDVIVVDIPDRLGRGDAIAKLELLADLNGARIEYATPGRDTSTVEGLALKATDQLVSGIERQNIRRRTMEGKRDWARRGRIIASAYRPYGYHFLSTYDEHGHKLTCQLVEDESEARVVTQIFEWLVGEALTLRSLAKRLNALSVVTRDGKPKWAPQTLSTLIRSTVYKGEWIYGKAIQKRFDTLDGVKRRRVGFRTEDDLVIVPCPAVISPELWEAAQAQLSENIKKFVKPTVHQYLLRGRIQCARCGSRLRGGGGRRRRGRREYLYYNCCMKSGVAHPCPSGGVNVRLLDASVWDFIVEALQHPERPAGGGRGPTPRS